MEIVFPNSFLDTTCYNYNSDLGIWQRWLVEAKLDWQNCGPTDVRP